MKKIFAVCLTLTMFLLCAAPAAAAETNPATREETAVLLTISNLTPSEIKDSVTELKNEALEKGEAAAEGIRIVRADEVMLRKLMDDPVYSFSLNNALMKAKSEPSSEYVNLFITPEIWDNLNESPDSPDEGWLLDAAAKETLAEKLEKETVLLTVSELPSKEVKGKAAELKKLALEKGEAEAEGVRIVKADGDMLRKLLDNPAFVPLLRRFSEKIEKGESFEYLNLFIKPGIWDELNGSKSDPDYSDPEYWESNYYVPEIYSGNYHGYKFLYLESEEAKNFISITPANVNASFNWANLASDVIHTALNYLIGLVSSPTSLFMSLVGDFSNNYIPSYNASFGETDESKFNVSLYGTLYTRTFLIRDDHDRVDGYAYYPWGEAEQYMYQRGVYAKYPYYQRTATTYEYHVINNIESMHHSVCTPGFYGGSAIYSDMINLYNSWGHNVHAENFDFDSMVTTILNGG